jgi:hypothetical protein
MNIQVEYKDQRGKISNLNYEMKRLAFIKHMAVAGQGYAPTPKKLFRTAGMFLHYTSYIQRQSFSSNRFSEPPIELSDPTEKAQFSNIAGKAIADFLSKRIDKSLHTVNYEAAMRVLGYPIKGKRPDLFAQTKSSMFSIEAKGRGQNDPGDMTQHKSQAQSGPINVNFSIACISYNLYDRINCNYYDPFNENIEYDNALLQALTRKYYSGLAEFLNSRIFEYRITTHQGEEFYEVGISYRKFATLFSEEFLFQHFLFPDLLRYYDLKLILPLEIRQYAENGITNATVPFIYEGSESDNYIYIDNDRVGLRVGPFVPEQIFSL